MGFDLAARRMQSISIPNLACQTCILIHYSFCHLLEIYLSLGTSAPINIRVVPLFGLSVSWKSSKNVKS